MSEAGRAATAKARRYEQDGPSSVPPAWLRDLWAEREITGGFVTDRRNPPCPVCFTHPSVSGACLCD